MSIESTGPRTLLLAAVTGWTVLVAILAQAGLGSRITPLADDPAGAARLPALPKTSPQGMGVLGQYTEFTQRPPFYESRRPQPFYLTGDADAQPSGFDYVLTSVLMTPGLHMAILQPSQGGEGIRIKQGEAANAAPQWKLVDLQPRAAVFEGPEGRRTLELRVFDGTGGQPPSVSGTPPPVPVPVPVGPPTGGNAPAQPIAGGVPAVPPAKPAQPQEPAEQPAMTTEQQMEAIRKRIEARRAQMRQQQKGDEAYPPAYTPNPNQ
ncbi:MULTISPECIES: general secretion pathway protein GspN [unclassified Pseudoxanthomonas]|uniref:general secretion pathway protein GspN n=1 Tax=unclassified Pseudoxanthomonas TaxID=2645906 RepID=UPI001612A10B|nr:MULTISPECIES: general secretion pathway protein GspN [unclassified Pseudoxanthomonas]MBB3275537.1 general secretion pathway protein N [Pseudoxanthomonas sp. OG2]MBD9377123.1 general secretion pathway protein GspN [Pseudoxanthomonas sp. PXM04]MBV7473375.1 general secretion pathway protein GspN [Pseudoxanthomonas sp. PXM05]